MSTFAEQLKKIRLRKGFSQAELAFRMGSDAGSISHWECGSRIPRLDTFISLCKALECSADELLGLKL